MKQEFNFTFYENLASIHTIEYCCSSLHTTYEEIVGRVFALKKKEGFKPYSEKRCVRAYPCAGITLKICDYSFPTVYVCINPRILTDNDHSYLGIFDATPDKIAQMTHKINETLRACGIPRHLQEMELCRVDLCLTLVCNVPELVPILLRCVKKADWDQNYKRVFFHEERRNAKEANEHSFQIAATHYRLTVYDKRFERQKRDVLPPDCPPALLRVEFSLQSRLGIEYYTKIPGMAHDKALLYLAQQSGRIIAQRLCDLLGTGVHVPYPLLEKMIDHQTNLKNKTRKRLKSLAMNFLMCENGLKASRMFCNELPSKINQDRCYRSLRKTLAEMELNPVPVPADVWIPVPSLALIVENILKSGEFTYKVDLDALKALQGF